MYTYSAKVWDLSIVQRAHFLCRQTLTAVFGAHKGAGADAARRGQRQGPRRLDGAHVGVWQRGSGATHLSHPTELPIEL
jgi:hypothetical protein